MKTLQELILTRCNYVEIDDLFHHTLFAREMIQSFKRIKEPSERRNFSSALLRRVTEQLCLAGDKCMEHHIQWKNRTEKNQRKTNEKLLHEIQRKRSLLPFLLSLLLSEKSFFGASSVFETVAAVNDTNDEMNVTIFYFPRRWERSSNVGDAIRSIRKMMLFHLSETREWGNGKREKGKQLEQFLCISFTRFRF